MVDAGGPRLEMETSGTGSPAVVFDAGMNGGMPWWRFVRDSVASRTTTVIFERAGFGGSDEGPRPRTAERLSQELRTALDNAGIEFPIILVGHSAGGLYSVVFAGLYPKDVAGIVLVDAGTDSTYTHMRDTNPELWADRSNPSRWEQGWNAPVGWVGQMEALPQSVQQSSASWPLPDVPTVVITALMPAGQYPLESAEDMVRWERHQLDLVARIPGAEHVILPEANHGSMLRESVLAQKLLDVVDRARGR
jgi:pimeloyl-ACP methyl ester carboxylesterase